jgi:outer membrane protein OmpA-like peptidoglycan-associated protein
MKMNGKSIFQLSLIVYCFFFLNVYSVKAQLTIDTSLTAKQLVEKLLLGQGVKVGKITYSGNKMAIAHYTATNLPIDLKEGILLCTGNVFDAIGPNTYPYTTTGFLDVKTQRKLKGDKDLNRIAHNMSYDGAVLEFDFIPLGNKISFTYCFGSEEYPEYVDSRYNDVFGFFINGPKYRNKNLATLPLSITPVTVNSINQHENKNAFIDNDFFTDVKPIKALPNDSKVKKDNKSSNSISDGNLEIVYKINHKKLKKINPNLVKYLQYDGFTKSLVAWCYVTPYQIYHIKIAIGDVGDNTYDSGVFLSANSFTASKDTKMPRFKDYPDLTNKLNYDSLFYGVKPKPILNVQAKIDSIDEQEAEAFAITNVNFESDSYVIPDTVVKRLTELVSYLKKQPRFICELYGYTDNQGNKEYNQKLSEHRSQAVMNFIVARGIIQRRFRIAGFNFERPRGDNSKEDGRAINRRVEIILVEQSKLKEGQK